MGKQTYIAISIVHRPRDCRSRMLLDSEQYNPILARNAITKLFNWQGNKTTDLK